MEDRNHDRDVEQVVFVETLPTSRHPITIRSIVAFMVAIADTEYGTRTVTPNGSGSSAMTIR
jgi:hypothetical protein